jgi:hypothetical protein
MQSSPLSCYLIPLKPKYPPQQSVLENPQPTFLLLCERPSFTSIAQVVLKDHSQSEAFVTSVAWLSFYGEELLAPRPIPKMEDHPLFAAAYSIYSQLPSISGGRSSIRSLKTRHAVVTGTRLSRTVKVLGPCSAAETKVM